jgi:hypothetical protein
MHTRQESGKLFPPASGAAYYFAGFGVNTFTGIRPCLHNTRLSNRVRAAKATKAVLMNYKRWMLSNRV